MTYLAHSHSFVVRTALKEIIGDQRRSGNFSVKEKDIINNFHNLFVIKDKEFTSYSKKTRNNQVVIIKTFFELVLGKFEGMFCKECIKNMLLMLKDIKGRKQIYDCIFPLYDIFYYVAHKRILNYRIIHQFNFIVTTINGSAVDKGLFYFSRSFYRNFLLIMKGIMKKDHSMFCFKSSITIKLHNEIKLLFEEYLISQQENPNFNNNNLEKSSNKYIRNHKEFHRMFPLFLQKIFLTECKKDLKDFVFFNGPKLPPNISSPLKKLISKISLNHNNFFIGRRSIKGLSLAIMYYYDSQLYDDIMRLDRQHLFFDNNIIQASKKIIKSNNTRLETLFNKSYNINTEKYYE
ncbi:MAG: hypothetical protein HeimC3_41290 [Candidatus Heimdallarchaeota archaeon LC_3]|nr:MAG: hypothetical protein HeimC3_41290 [Candidatus Heimdallarchaeota archaeon LC_3]